MKFENMELAVKESNLIEGEPTSGPSYMGHLFAAKCVELAAEEGELLHPRLLHYLAFQNLYDFAGRYRRVNIYVTGSNTNFAQYIDIPRHMEQFWSEVRDDLLADPWMYHVEFETIHPFQDGNGRTGRLLMWNMELLQEKEPTIIYYKDRMEYYAKLENVRKGK